MKKKGKCFLHHNKSEFDSDKRERSMSLSFIPLLSEKKKKKRNSFKDILQGYMLLIQPYVTCSLK